MPAPTLNGHVNWQFTNTASGTSGTLNVSGVNNVIVVVCGAETANGSTPSVSSVTATGLTFARRSVHTMAGANGSQFVGGEIWWTVAASAFSGTITVAYTASIDNAALVAFGVSGCANPSAPWDTNGSLPASATNGTFTNVQPSDVISTTAASSFVFGAEITGGNDFGHFSTSAGYTHLDNNYNGAGTYYCDIWVDYATFASVQSSISVSEGSSNSNWLYVVDALAGTATPTFLPSAPNSYRPFVPVARAASW